jgi:hypothetical protein
LRRHVQPKNFREAGVGENQALGGIHHGDTLHHASENGRGKIALFGQRSNGAIQSRRGLIQGGRQSLHVVPGTIRFNRAKISFRHAQRKPGQPVHTIRERAGDQQGHHTGHQEHDERGQPEPPAKIPKLFIRRLRRQCKT